MPRRRTGVLLPLELRILDAGLRVQTPDAGFHGFLLASHLGGEGASPSSAGLTSHGTLYKALARLTESGLLEAEWEDPAVAESAGRPRRRLYRVTPQGATALAQARSEAPAPSSATRPVEGLA